MINTDARLEPLPIVISQRYRGNRQTEDLARHPGYTVEALACGGIEQF